ncbi:hypothetical protein KEM48_006542 [Puccinia striiformis f. sp. tritici PST-130]|nr:hypothetical protein KEM48_006542 [Puccinia striiformis f. sp. tritici PST-130]
MKQNNIPGFATLDFNGPLNENDCAPNQPHKDTGGLSEFAFGVFYPISKTIRHLHLDSNLTRFHLFARILDVESMSPNRTALSKCFGVQRTIVTAPCQQTTMISTLDLGCPFRSTRRQPIHQGIFQMEQSTIGQPIKGKKEVRCPWATMHVT